MVNDKVYFIGLPGEYYLQNKNDEVICFINDINNINIVNLGEEKYNEFIEIIFSEDC